jgi:hypothetical protein
MNYSILGMFFWLVIVVAGSLAISIPYHNHLNSIPGFQSTFSNLAAVTFLLSFLAFLLTIPLFFAIKFLVVKQDYRKRSLLLLNAVSLVYAFFIAFILSYLTTCLLEAITMILPYFVLTFLFMNVYLKLKHKAMMV